MASVLARSKLLVAPNPLAYPAGVKPGFDPGHPASLGCTFSGVTLGGNGVVDLTTGQPGTINGTVGSAIDGGIGPAVNFTTANVSNYVSFPGKPAAADTAFTVAGIFRAGASNAGVLFSTSSTVSSGLGLGNSGVNFSILLQGVTSLTGPTLNPGETCFAVGSGVKLAAGWLFTMTVKWLLGPKAGQIQSYASQTAFTTAMGTPAGTYAFGCRPNNAAGSYIGNVAAAMYARGNALNVQQQLQWAQDPWSFWYPRPPIQYSTPATTTTATGGARVRQRFNRSVLAYPAGAVPGFDPGHVAANGALISCVPSGGNFVSVGAGSITGGVVGTPTTVSALVHGQFGPVVNNAGSGTNGVTFSSFPSLTLASCTIAAFALTTGSTGAAEMVASNTLAGGTASGFGVRFGAAGGVIQILMNNTVYNSSITPVANVPYFIVASAGNSSANLVVVNLQTGQVLTSVFAVNASTGSGSTFQISNGGGTRALKGYSGPAMMNNQYMSMPQLLAWASDPWSFWYPNKTINLTSTAVSVGASFLPVWAFDYNLSVLGTGTF